MDFFTTSGFGNPLVHRTSIFFDEIRALVIDHYYYNASYHGYIEGFARHINYSLYYFNCVNHYY